MTRRESETHCLYRLRMPSLLEFFKKLKCFKMLRFLSFEFISYFDIRISNLVAATGRYRLQPCEGFR